MDAVCVLEKGGTKIHAFFVKIRRRQISVINLIGLFALCGLPFSFFSKKFSLSARSIAFNLQLEILACNVTLPALVYGYIVSFIFGFVNIVR